MNEVISEDTAVAVATITPSSKLQVVTVNGRKFIANARWNTCLVADHVIEEGTDRWMKVGEVAKFAHVTNNIPNKEKVRRRLSALFRELLDRGLFLAIEYGKNQAALAIKIADLKLDGEKQLVMRKIMRMRKSKELTQAQYEKSISLLHKTIC
jgi:hypothetical protein